MPHLRLIGILVTLTVCASTISAEPVVRHTGLPWPDTRLARVEILALIETLNARLLGAITATEVLNKWCSDHHLAGDPAVHARRLTGVDKPISPEQRERLKIGPDEPVAYRRVELVCGEHVLVEADNWYVPGRLTPKINTLLTTTDTPFGWAVRELQPWRRNFSVVEFWKPLPDGWELTSPQDEPSGAALAIPWQLFQHQAVLYNGADEPFSEVREIYTREVLAFGPP
ncbi:MAG: hypothetical protein FWD08_05785 [Alphaproteobacteria bacterium]|nr:hypothetical protein [Alphaproteobacteria bacterium]